MSSSFKVILTFSLLIAGISARADNFRYALDTKNLNTTQVPAIQAFLNNAVSLLPASLKNHIAQTLTVHFVPTKTDVVGMAARSKKEISLSLSLIPEILKGPAASTVTKRPHGNMYNEALATVLHETTHIYDDTVTLDQRSQDYLTQCNAKSSQSDICMSLRHPTYLSSDRAFRRVSGWYGKNYVFTFRQDDAYEGQNPRETLAVNMEYFLMDPTYACRKPSLARFLSEKFQMTSNKGACQLQSAYVNSAAASPKDVLSELPMDRVYEIDYLLAGAGTSLESRFGHAMFRLVICPEGKPLTADCRKDISSHLVLSFRASVTDFQTSGWKGIVGDYPSRLFILPLTQVIQEYSSSQLRDLQALPLKLNAEEKQRFLERTLEYHWNYQGRYYFLTNNCADESLNLLSSSLLRPELLTESVATPNGLYDDLKRMKLIDTSVLVDKALATKNGSYFPSYQQRFDIAFAKIQKYSGQKFDMKIWESYSSDERLAVFNQTLPAAQKQNDGKALAAAFFILEGAIQKDIENAYLNSVAAKIMKDQKDNKASSVTDSRTAAEIADDAKDYLYTNSQLVNPSAILVGQPGYGLPNQAELDATADAFAQLGEKYQNTQNDMINSIKSLFDPGLLAELQKIQTHIQVYLMQITTKPITKGI